MPNPYKVVLLLLVAACSLGAATMWQPHRYALPKEDAESVGPLYAVPLERVETHVIGPGETLSGVFSRAAIAGREFADMLLALREHQSPRRLASGTEVTVRRWAESGEMRAVDIRLNADSTVRLAPTDLGWRGQIRLTPVVVDTVFVAGRIEEGRTLYEAMVLDETSELPASERIRLVSDLAEVYEYKLDFTREIQPGDSYRIVYEREARPDGTARSRRILISEVHNNGIVFKALWFDKGKFGGNYFDENGRSMQRGFSRYPVRFARVTSNFSPNRYHPVLGKRRPHNGTDYGARTGEPIRATADGVIIFQGRNGGYGNVIEIRHGNGYTTRYAHMSRFAANQSRGTVVKQGQTIGYVGATGLATGPHLHYELHHRGRPIDARTAKLPDGDPVPGVHQEEFAQLVQTRLALLDQAGPLYAAAAPAARARAE